MRLNTRQVEVLKPYGLINPSNLKFFEKNIPFLSSRQRIGAFTRWVLSIVRKNWKYNVIQPSHSKGRGELKTLSNKKLDWSSKLGAESSDPKENKKTISDIKKSVDAFKNRRAIPDAHSTLPQRCINES